MAQKENQQSNGINRNTPGCKKKGSNGVDSENPVADTNYSNNDVQFRQKGPGVSVNRTKGVYKRKKQKSEFDGVRKSGDSESDESETPYKPRKVTKTFGVQISAASFITFCNMFGAIETVLSKCRSSEAVAGVRAAASYVFRTAAIWLEQLQPQLKSVVSVIYNVQKYVRSKVDHTYPIILTRAVFFGRLVFLLSMVWLDCVIRGLDSLLHLGSTSFFTVIWCSIISVSAMVGFTKMLLIMVIVTLLAVFVSLGLAILVISISALVILWLYGSFWTTGFVILLGGMSFVLGHERVALLVTNLYSFYCATSYVGWLGLLLGLNLSFISSDLLLYILKNNIIEPNSDEPTEQARYTQGKTDRSFSETFYSSQGDDGIQFSFESSVDRNRECSSTSGVEVELTSEGEVARLLNCTDHYSALGFARYENIDITQLKKEYKKKAMLVHPDKNMGNEKAAEAFKKLQNAYEVLLDSLKRKTYDDELRREELLNYFRRFQSSSRKKGRQGFFRPGFSHSEAEYEGPYVDSRRIACKKCNNFHIWNCTQRSKSQARWCQECQEFHQAKDGDGWVEQSFQSLLFGLLQKGNLPRMYVCAESRIYDVTDWFICQGMRCAANTHKPSFHVNASVMKQTNSKGNNPTARNGAPSSNIDETMTEEEFVEWLQNAVQSGRFDAAQSPKTGNDTQSPKAGCSSSSTKKKRKGKKQQW